MFLGGMIIENTTIVINEMLLLICIIIQLIMVSPVTILEVQEQEEVMFLDKSPKFELDIKFEICN